MDTESMECKIFDLEKAKTKPCPEEPATFLFNLKSVKFKLIPKIKDYSAYDAIVKKLESDVGFIGYEE